MSRDSLTLTGGYATVCCDFCDLVFDVKYTEFSTPQSIDDDGDTEHTSVYKGKCVCGHDIEIELEVWSCNGYSTLVELNGIYGYDNHFEFEIERNQ